MTADSAALYKEDPWSASLSQAQLADRLAELRGPTPCETASGPAIEPAVRAAAADQPSTSPATGLRRLRLTPASAIPLARVHWLWDQRIAMGSLTLIGGREDAGKSTLAYTVAADVSRGRLPGEYARQPRGVIVVATEDSWSHTIAPRLIAADADLDRVYRTDAITAAGDETGLSLPMDISALGDAIIEHDVALVLLDPLMSRLSEALDTHKDAEVRRGLEPLVKMADTSSAAIIGLIHVNKKADGDALTSLMGSRAFAAVARGVMFVVRDNDDRELRLLAQPKNNLGTSDPVLRTFRIEGFTVDTPDGPNSTARLVWLGDSTRLLDDVLKEAGESDDSRESTTAAGDWLHRYMLANGGQAAASDVKADCIKAGHSYASVQRARRRADPPITSTRDIGVFPAGSRWQMVIAPASSHGESAVCVVSATSATSGEH